MTLTAISRKALIKSIAKWQAIVDGTGLDHGINDCALCSLFYGDTDNELVDRCIDCPVLEKTGFDGCVGTPYIDWAQHQRERHAGHVKGIHTGCEICLQTATAELNFLQNLLAESEQQK